MSLCDEIRRRLAEEGPQAVLADEACRTHLEGCADCAAVLRGIEALEAALPALPEHDASDELVAATLAAVRQTEAPPAAGGWHVGRRHWAGALAATVVLAAVFGLGHNLFRSSGQWDELAELAIGQKRPADRLEGREQAGAELGRYRRGNEDKGELAETEAARSGDANAPAPESHLKLLQEKKDLDRLARTAPKEALMNRRSDAVGGTLDREAELVQRLQQFALADKIGEDEPASPGKPTFADNKIQPLLDRSKGASESLRKFESRESDIVQLRSGAAGGRLAGPATEEEPVSRQQAVGQSQVAAAPPPPPARELFRAKAPALGIDAARARRRAEAWLDRIARLDDLSFQPATGYWANTYIPGDPTMRLIEARLSGWDRRQFGQASLLDQAVRPVTQPFDAPRDAALALYLDADATAIAGPTRLRVQVGLKGAERQGGHRPAMNLGLVVDARQLADGDLGPRLRALIASLVRARQAGDRFSLTVAGPGGGTAVEPEAFRHGPLQVALARLFDGGGKGPAVGLAEAVRLAAESVRQGDREDAILGTSVVLLATSAPLGSELAALEALAHENAVGGIPMSVVALGPAVDPADLDRLVAAGQGSRRRLLAGDNADAVVDAELHAASRVVARAVRLRIRLAPGVKLVDVLGSRRLDQPQAARVRQAEQAIDRRLARNLGITADRGADEEGIQIVIPNFYAGDAHVVLLDVVAERPGPIADVTARYKDVVRLKNGVAEARLALGNQVKPAGPLERNVEKNLLAYELAASMRAHGLELEAGFDPGLLLELADLRDLVHGLRLAVPGWAGDPELAEDEAVLEGYLVALRSPLAQDRGQQIQLGQSLRHLSFAKLHTRHD